MGSSTKLGQTKISIDNRDALFSAIKQALKNNDVVSLVKVSKNEVFIIPGRPPEDDEDIEY